MCGAPQTIQKESRESNISTGCDPGLRGEGPELAQCTGELKQNLGLVSGFWSVGELTKEPKVSSSAALQMN